MDTIQHRELLGLDGTAMLVESEVLGYYDENDKDLGSEALPRRTFGVMMKLAAPIVNHYFSDFYSDAEWVQKYIANGDVDRFYYGADDCGTAIGIDLELVCTARKNVWRFEIVLRNKRWDLLVFKVR